MSCVDGGGTADCDFGSDDIILLLTSVPDTLARLQHHIFFFPLLFQVIIIILGVSSYEILRFKLCVDMFICSFFIFVIIYITMHDSVFQLLFFFFELASSK